MARPDHSCVCISRWPRRGLLAGADRAGLAAAQYLLRLVQASPIFMRSRSFAPSAPAPPSYDVMEDILVVYPRLLL